MFNYGVHHPVFKAYTWYLNLIKLHESGADPRMVQISTAPPPFWQINHANSTYFRLFLGYFWVISATRPPLLDLAPPFLHILDPPLWMDVMSQHIPICMLSSFIASFLHPHTFLWFKNNPSVLRGFNPEIVKNISRCNFIIITVMYIKAYIFGMEMSQRIHFWYQILPKMLIFWENGKKSLFW